MCVERKSERKLKNSWDPAPCALLYRRHAMHAAFRRMQAMMPLGIGSTPLYYSYAHSPAQAASSCAAVGREGCHQRGAPARADVEQGASRSAGAPAPARLTCNKWMMECPARPPFPQPWTIYGIRKLMRRSSGGGLFRDHEPFSSCNVLEGADKGAIDHVPCSLNRRLCSQRGHR